MSYALYGVLKRYHRMISSLEATSSEGPHRASSWRRSRDTCKKAHNHLKRPKVILDLDSLFLYVYCIENMYVYIYICIDLRFIYIYMCLCRLQWCSSQTSWSVIKNQYDLAKSLFNTSFTLPDLCFIHTTVFGDPRVDDETARSSFASASDLDKWASTLPRVWSSGKKINE